MAEKTQPFPPDAVTGPGTADSEQKTETELKTLGEKILERIEKMGKLLETQPSMADDILGAITTIRAKAEEIPETERGATTVALRELQQRALNVNPEEGIGTKQEETKKQEFYDAFKRRIDETTARMGTDNPPSQEELESLKKDFQQTTPDQFPPGQRMVLTKYAPQKMEEGFARWEAMEIEASTNTATQKTNPPPKIIGGPGMSRTEAELLSEGVSAALLAPESPARNRFIYGGTRSRICPTIIHTISGCNNENRN